MSTATARACRSNFTSRIAPPRSRKSPEIKPFHGHWITFAGKARCIKRSVLLDPVCCSGDFLISIFRENGNVFFEHFIHSFCPETPLWMSSV